MKKIGLIGGLSPESTIEYYRLLIEEYRRKIEKAGAPEIIIYSLNLNEFLELNESKNREGCTRLLLKAFEGVSRAGADFAIVAAVTPHIYLNDIIMKTSISIISIVDEVCNSVKREGLKKVGLFGTKYTMQSGLFESKFMEEDISIIMPIATHQKFIHLKLIDELQYGVINEKTRSDLLNIVDGMIKEHEIEGLILGCTELPLILKNDDKEIPFFDSSRIHVESTIELALKG